MSEQRSTPLCGECPFFRVDEKRTGRFRLGWCAKRSERHDRCDLMPECSDGVLGYTKATIPNANSIKQPEQPKKKNPHNGLKVRCVQTGKEYASISEAAIAYGLDPKSLWWAMTYSQNGIKKKLGITFEYMN